MARPAAEHDGWDLDEPKPQFEELALEDGALEVPGFTECEIEQVLLDDEPETVEPSPLTPSVHAAAVARPSEVFVLGWKRVNAGMLTIR